MIIESVVVTKNGFWIFSNKIIAERVLSLYVWHPFVIVKVFKESSYEPVSAI
jgi:hypothetical protein